LRPYNPFHTRKLQSNTKDFAFAIPQNRYYQIVTKKLQLQKNDIKN